MASRTADPAPALATARRLVEEGRVEDAIAHLRQLLDRAPDATDVRLELGALYRQLGRTADAIREYGRAAASFLRDGEPLAALEPYRAACELRPHDAAALAALGELYAEWDRDPAAAADLARSVTRLRDAGRIDEYIQVAELLASHVPFDLATVRDLARVYLDRGDPRRAFQALQRCFIADRRDPETLTLLATALVALDQVQKAVDVLRELAQLHVQRGEAAEALLAWSRVLDLRPKDAQALAILGFGRERGQA